MSWSKSIDRPDGLLYFTSFDHKDTYFVVTLMLWLHVLIRAWIIDDFNFYIITRITKLDNLNACY